MKETATKWPEWMNEKSRRFFFTFRNKITFEGIWVFYLGISILGITFRNKITFWVIWVFYLGIRRL